MKRKCDPTSLARGEKFGIRGERGAFTFVALAAQTVECVELVLELRFGLDLDLEED